MRRPRRWQTEIIQRCSACNEPLFRRFVPHRWQHFVAWLFSFALWMYFYITYIIRLPLGIALPMFFVANIAWELAEQRIYHLWWH